ncbi:hypothetical protein BDZ94DRAFT_1262274 [Collybia nuda]|uniref:MYND-type domain-containing protein n=1 Tax=Collybia nuda TaxID=64659 RepID=A0A9P5Y4D7_9AGAR|nr:hypothetical protein BDZ94DRAFT_1262274 [Collybia nuda]
MAKCKACNDPASRKCSGCSRVWYCKQECQRADWVRHIFDCKPRREINTADHLALAVHENLLPEDNQTCLDYGFTAAFTASERANLLGLYIGLITYCKIKPQTLHKWRLQGTLVREIKAVYQDLPEQSRGGYYAWFLQNEHVLNTSSPDPSDKVREIRKRAWVFIGGSAADDEAEIVAKTAAWSQGRQICYSFYLMLLADWHPGPSQDMWVYLGFCACQDLQEEMLLSGHYKWLIHKCTFDEFATAYESSTLLGLLRSDNPYYRHISGLEDVLAGSPQVFKSVWWLKQFAMASESADEGVSLRPSVRADYGFMNCKTEDEFKALRRLYKEVFEKPHVDPVKLHVACIQGKLFEFLGGEVDLSKKKKKFTRLLKNLYPLPDI